MITKARQPLVSSRHAALLLGSAALIGLFLTSLYRYLLFPILAEFFSVVVFTIFVITWNSRRFIDNGYLLFLGISLVSADLKSRKRAVTAFSRFHPGRKA